MKAFEKWWDNKKAKYYGFGTPICQESRAENLAHLHDEEIWRAALEWVLNDCVLPNGMPCHSLIKEELEQ